MNERSVTDAPRPNDGQAPARKTWQAPQLARMGSVAELTRRVDFTGRKDNAQWTFVKT